RPAAEPLGSRGSSGGRDGHELREPGALGRARRQERRLARGEGLRRAGGDRQGDRTAQARDDGRRDRHAHGGAGPLPRVLGRGDVALRTAGGSTVEGFLEAVGARTPAPASGAGAAVTGAIAAALTELVARFGHDEPATAEAESLRARLLRLA